MMIRIAIWTARIIPLAARRAIFSGLARLFYHLSLKHRLITVHNLVRSFPQKEENEILTIAKKSYFSFAILVAEFCDILYLNKENLSRWITIRGLDHYTAACEQKKGVLLFGAHFGNWEIGNAALSITTKPLIFVYRLLDNPFMEGLITKVRSSCGITSLDKENAMRPLIRSLKKGQTINILIDQNVAVYDGVFINFFGRPACATSGLALLAQHTGAPVLPVFTTRQPDGKYILEIGREVGIERSGERDADILSNTQKFNSIIENHICQYPEQWFWMHQRWKTKLCQRKKT